MWVTISVLYICTGNICRSPMAERLLLARAATGSVQVASAGTYGLDAYPMDAQAALVARDLGADPDGHTSRELTAAQITEADLVLTATGEHRDLLLRQSPRAMRRAFTMLEFTRLGRDLPPLAGPPDHDGLVARIAEVAGQRGQVDVPAPGADDIGDPFGGPLEAMRACGEQIAASVDGLIVILGLPGRA